MKSSSENFLLASESSSFSLKTYELLQAGGFSCDHAFSGKDTQALLYKNSYKMLILDLNLSNFSSIEILKFIKLSKLTVKVLLFSQDLKLLNSLGLGQNQLFKMGVSDFISAQRPEKVVEKIAGLNHSTSWKSIEIKEEAETQQTEVKIFDRDLTRISLKEAMISNIAVFDHFIKLASNKYVKIVKQGQPFPVVRLQKYAESGCEFLYFLTKDRIMYINFMNEVTQKLVSSKESSGGKSLKIVNTITDKYLEEVYTTGVRPELVEEGKKLCQNIYKMITADSNLNSLLNCMEEMDPASFSHSFLVTFYSSLICKHVDWIGPKALETIAMGCLLHDIGLINLPPKIRESGGKDLSPADLAIYYSHSSIGAEMLQSFPAINEQVRQIIYQHHECVNGLGYPNGLTGLKIYPLAKIISLADAFTDQLVEKKLSPKDTLRSFLMDREAIMKHDSNLIKSLVAGLSKKV